MNLDEQMLFTDELSTKFLELDKKFSIFPEYDGLYRVWADNMDEIFDSLGRLKDLEK